MEIPVTEGDGSRAGTVNGFERRLAGIVTDDLAVFRAVMQVIGGRPRRRL